MIVTRATDPGIILEACISITATIPEWFGQPAANERYAREIGDCDCFLAERNGEAIGLIALRFHFDETAEIWWPGVRRDDHRTGAGRARVGRSPNDVDDPPSLKNRLFLAELAVLDHDIVRAGNLDLAHAIHFDFTGRRG